MKLCSILLITFMIAIVHSNAASTGEPTIINDSVPVTVPISLAPTITSKSTATPKKRYHIVPYVKADWIVANMYCRSIGMRPPAILSMEEQDEIVKVITDADLADQSFWTTGRKIEGTIIPQIYTTYVWYWFDTGVKVNFTNWGEGEPNNKYGNEDCLGLYDFVQLKWNDFTCDTKLNIICEEDVAITKTESQYEYPIFS